VRFVEPTEVHHDTDGARLELLGGPGQVVRCSADLSSCTRPVVLSQGQKVAEYPWVTIGPDGRTYITWGQFFVDSFIGPAQRAWIAVAEPGSTTFTRHPIGTRSRTRSGFGWPGR
jgi:hypothetical protein